MNKPPEVFWAWLAGFIDGDGCLTLASHKNAVSITPQISIGQKNRKILDYIKDEVGFGYVGMIGKQKDRAVLHWTHNQAKKILLRINPYLKLKAEQGKLLLRACYLNNFCHKRNSQPTFLKAYHGELNAIDRKLRQLKKLQVKQENE